MLITASYLDTEDTRYGAVEKIRVCLFSKNLKDLSNVSLCVEIRTVSDIRLASYALYDFYPGMAGKTAELKVELDPSPFVEGFYYMTFIFFEHEFQRESG